jgi:hypothetical protein
MNRTIKDATVKRYFYETHDELRAHLRDFLDAYNFARRLKTLKGLTPYEFICKAWTSQPQRFIISPLQKMPDQTPNRLLKKSAAHGRNREHNGIQGSPERNRTAAEMSFSTAC